MPNLLNSQLTKKQAEVFGYLEKFQQKEKYSPALKNVADHFDVSVPTIFQHVDYLERKGYLVKEKGVKYSIRLLKKLSDIALVFPQEEVQSEIETTKYKKLPLNKIILGDALVELKKLPSESCDVIVIDPPYNIGKDFGNNIDKREMGEYVSWCKEWINQCIRVMKPNGTMFIYGFSEILAYLSVEIPINKRWLIWHYTNKNVASLHFWQRSHESIICAWKEKPVFNRDEVREPYTEGFLNGAAGKTRKGTIGRFSSSGKETTYNAHAGGALPRDVIKIPALAGGAGMNERWFMCKTCKNIFAPRELKNHVDHEIEKHPTQKPFELSKKLILSATPKKDGVILVPFVGTGSECAAAKALGQNYIGFEINPDYVKMAEKYIASVEVTSRLF
ncbi:MAG: DNA methyltransferase [Minisyncoccia bacterium]